MACGINLRHKSLAEIAFNTEAQARLQTRGTSLAELGLSSDSLAQVQMRSSSLASIQMALGCPAGDEDDLKLITQDQWYVDSVNGLDTNPGSLAQPLKTKFELARRTFNGVFPQPTQFHFLNDIPDTDPGFFQLYYAGPPTGQIEVLGDNPSVLLAATLTGAVTEVPASNIRNSITVAGIDWTTAGPGGTTLIGKRLRRTSDDAVAKIQKLGGANDTVIISQPFAGSSSRTLSTGDAIVVEDLTKLGPINVIAATSQQEKYPVALRRLRSAVDSSSFIRAELTEWQDCDLDLDNGGSGWFELGAASNLFTACRVSAGSFKSGNSVALIGCAIKLGEVTGKQLNILFCEQQDRQLQLYNTDVLAVTLSCWDWPSNAAIVLARGTYFDSAGPLWGTSASSGTFAVRTYGGIHAQYATVPVLSGALSGTKDLEIGDASIQHTDLPYINALNGARMVLRAT